MGSQAGSLVVIHKSRRPKNTVIPAWTAGIQSLRTVTCRLHKCLIQVSCQPLGSHPCDWIPAVHAGMTGFNHLCITTRAPAFSRSQAPAWECGLGSSSFPRQDKLELASDGFPSWSFTAIKLSRHTGMDRRYPDCRDAPKPAPSLEPGFRRSMPERRCFVNLMAVKLELGNQHNQSKLAVGR